MDARAKVSRRAGEKQHGLGKIILVFPPCQVGIKSAVSRGSEGGGAMPKFMFFGSWRDFDQHWPHRQLHISNCVVGRRNVHTRAVAAPIAD